MVKHLVVVRFTQQNLGPIGSTVLKFIEYKHTDKHLYRYKVVISVCLSGCLSVCLSDHNSGTTGPICLKLLFENSGDPRECSELGFESLS